MIYPNTLYKAFQMTPQKPPHGFCLQEQMDLVITGEDPPLAHLLLHRHEQLTALVSLKTYIPSSLDVFFSLSRSGRLCLSIPSPTLDDETPALIALIRRLMERD